MKLKLFFFLLITITVPLFAMENPRGTKRKTTETDATATLFTILKTQDQTRYANIPQLINQGANIYASSDDGVPMILLAAETGNYTILQQLLELGANPDAQDTFYFSPLLVATRSGNIPIVRLLLQHGADLNIRDFDGNTPLLQAIFSNDEDIIAMLLLAGADTNIKNNGGKSPISILKYKLETTFDPVLEQKYEKIIGWILNPNLIPIDKSKLLKIQ